MNIDTIQGLLAQRGVLSVPGLFMDEEYALPTRRWVTTTFSNAFWENLRAIGVVSYQPGKNDCDKFARRAWAEASDMHARMPGHEDRGLAFGIFLYQSAQGPHAINFSICGETPEDVLFWEPQNQREVKLTREEIESCFGYIV